MFPPTEHIRIIRRLDFTQQARIEHTYEEHAQLLRTHIEASKDEVRKTTLHRLYRARTAHR